MIHIDFGWLKLLGPKKLKLPEHQESYTRALKQLREKHPKGPAPIDELLVECIACAYHDGQASAQRPFWQCHRCGVANDEGKLYCARCGAKRDQTLP